MSKADSLKKQIDLLPPSLLDEVERLVKKLRKKGKTVRMPTTPLTQLTAYTIPEDELPTDLAEQHDHYLYGVPKR